LGHVVLRVTSRARAEGFYNGLLGVPICGHYDKRGMKMTFFSLGNHHDFAVLEVTGEGSTRSESATGLHHVAFCIGRKLDDLRDAKTRLETAGIRPMPVDHFVTKSLYFAGPDGNGVELYVDSSNQWRTQPECIAYAEPMELA
jgi:catechol 2,3-dioxygenase